jgi:hypothetical protein
VLPVERDFASGDMDIGTATLRDVMPHLLIAIEQRGLDACGLPDFDRAVAGVRRADQP